MGARLGGAVTSAQAAKDFDELKAYAASKGIKMSESLRGWDVGALKEAVAGVEDAIAVFPEIAGYDMFYIDDQTIRGSVIASASLGGRIYLNSPKWKADGSLASLQEAAEVAQMIHFHPGKTPRNFVSHEVGHLVESILIHKDFGQDPGSGFTYAMVLAWNKHEYAKSVISEAAKRAKKTERGKGKKIDQLIADVSQYATKNRAEALAECFADYVENGSNANPLSIEVYNVLKERLA